MSELILALVVACAAWSIRGAFLDREEEAVEQLLEELEGAPAPPPTASTESSPPG